MNLAERAVASAKAARLTIETREKVSAALEVPAGEREPLLVLALSSAISALDVLTELLIATRDGS